MKIKVIAKKSNGLVTEVYYLNQTEPKKQQLYMAVITDFKIKVLTIYNYETNRYEDTTALFPISFLQKLSQQLFLQSDKMFHDSKDKESLPNDSFKVKNEA